MGRRGLPDPERLLRDGGQVRIEELFRLIHRVNPTDRGLSQSEERRRYTLKSGLQSLLVERFGTQLRARAESEDLVILEHISGERDACHAPLSALSPEARSWVRWQLDAVDEPKTSAPSPQAASLSTTVLDDARRALDEYDYPLAEQLLRDAFAASGGGATEALALLELLVEHLGLDKEALALESGLDRGARKHPRVRGLLAMAAARLGRLVVASRLLDGLSGQAEVHAVLARQALALEQLDLAGSCLGNLSDADPAHPALAKLGDELQARRDAHRADLRRPAEAELERLHEEQKWPLLLERANALLRQFPGSTVAASSRARAEAALLAGQIAELVASADKAEARGDHASAVEKLERAERLGADVRKRLGELRKAAALERSREAVDRVRALLPGREGLLAWAALSVQDRGAFREPRLKDLGALLSAGGRKPEPAIDALLAMEALSPSMSVEQRLACLQPHARLLERSRWRRLLNQLRTEAHQLELQRKRDAKADDASRRAAEEVGRFDAAAEREDWLAARRIARRHDDDVWKERLERSAQELRRSWGLRVQSGELLPYADLRDFRMASMLRGVNPFMTAPDEILLGNRAGPLIMLRRVGADGQVRELVELRPPGGLKETVCPEVHGDLVFFHSGPRLIVLRHTPTWDIVDDIDLVELASKEPKEVVVVDGRYAWLATDDRTYVVDLVDRRVDRAGEPSNDDFELAGWRGATAVARLAQEQVVVCRRRDPNAVLGTWDVRHARTPTVGPGGELLLLGVEDDLPDGPLELFVLGPLLRGSRTLKGTSRRMPMTLACERERGLVFTYGCDARGHREVRAFRMKGVEPVEIWRAPVPRATELIVHREGLAVGLIILSVHGGRVLRLGEEAPELPDEVFSVNAGPPHMGPPFTLVAEVEFRKARRNIKNFHPELLEEGAEIPDAEALGVITALQARNEGDRASRLLAEQLARHPASAPLRLLRAAERANLREWDTALALVRDLTEIGLSSGQRYWKHMLECMCLARLGDVDGAHLAAKETLRIEPNNDGSQAVERVLAALRGVGDREAFTAFNQDVANLVHSLADAAKALRERRYRDVLKHADNPHTWGCWEAGGLYMICRAWQALSPTDPIEVARARAAAGCLLEALDHKDHLPLGDLTPTREAMEELALELLGGLIPGELPDLELSLEDIALAWEEDRSARDSAEDFGCSVVSVYAARRTHRLTVPPGTRAGRVAVLRRCGWTEEDAEWMVDQVRP